MYPRKAFAALLSVLFILPCASAAVEEASCGDYYHFDGLRFMELAPEKAVYITGETVNMRYSLENDFGSPLVQGDVRVLMMYQGPSMDSRKDDADIVDDYLAEKDLNLQAGDNYSGTFIWKIPKNAKPGYYLVNAYFPVDEKFNAAGLTFMSSVPAIRTSFKVSGSPSDVCMLDKGSTTFNGNAYDFRGPLPGIKPGQSVDLRTKLINLDKDPVILAYELYKWDDTGSGIKSYARTESVSDSKDLEYQLSGLPVGVYVARITASLGERNWKSILKVRFFVQGSRARFVWVGLDRFPLAKGDKASLAFCLSNSASEPGDTGIASPASVRLNVSDGSGAVIAKGEYPITDLSSVIKSGKMDVVAPGRLTLLTVDAVVYDAGGAAVDKVELVYDYSKFENNGRTFKLTAPGKAYGKLDYSIDFLDKYGDPIGGEVAVYLSAQSGDLVRTREARFKGHFEGEFNLTGLQEGVYELKAVEKSGPMSDGAKVSVGNSSDEPAGQTVAPQEKEPQASGSTGKASFDYFNPWLLGGVACLLLVLLVAFINYSRGGK